MRRIRETYPQTKVVIMTASQMEDVTRSAIREMAYRLISKPFDLAEVRDIANEVVGHPG